MQLRYDFAVLQSLPLYHDDSSAGNSSHRGRYFMGTRLKQIYALFHVYMYSSPALVCGTASKYFMVDVTGRSQKVVSIVRRGREGSEKYLL